MSDSPFDLAHYWQRSFRASESRGWLDTISSAASGPLCLPTDSHVAAAPRPAGKATLGRPLVWDLAVRLFETWPSAGPWLPCRPGWGAGRADRTVACSSGPGRKAGTAAAPSTGHSWAAGWQQVAAEGENKGNNGSFKVASDRYCHWQCGEHSGQLLKYINLDFFCIWVGFAESQI